MKKLAVASVLLYSLLGNSHLHAQTFGMPVMPTPQPATMPRYDNFGRTAPAPNTNGQVQMGATADDIIRQANRSNPYYGAGSDPASIQRANEAWIHAQMDKDPAYNPSLRNGVRSQAPLSKQDEINLLLREAGISENPATSVQRLTSDYYKSQDFKKATSAYENALQHLKNMLSGKEKLSIAQAYFAVENAYGNSYLTQKEFNDIISKSTLFSRSWIKQEGMNLQNNDDVQLAIQKFMSERLVVYKYATKGDGKMIIGRTEHKPFFYDYADYQGEKDFKNYFLSKCLATGGGQCSSMPAVYLSLAEALGVTAYLTLAPQHSFVKYKDNNGNVVNYEPTSNWKMSDNWYRDNMFITTTAKRNRIYLDTFNRKQIVADCMLSLAIGYMKKFGAADASFVSECLTEAERQFPHENLQCLFVRSSLLARMLNATLYNSRISSFNDLGKSKQATDLYRALQQNEEKITTLGYKPEPVELYNELLKQHEFKGTIQDSLHIDGKKKRSLFIETSH